MVTFGVDFGVEPSGRLSVAALLFALLSTVLFALGLVPLAHRSDERSQAGAGSADAPHRPRMLLLVGQLAVSLALVAAGGLFARAAVNATGADAGFPLQRQVVVGLDPSLAGYDENRTRATYGAILERVRALPGSDAGWLMADG